MYDLCMGMRVAVAGASGYAGGEALRLLAAHPEFDLAAVCAGSSAGQLVGEIHPHLVSLASRRFEATDASVLADSDLVILGLPHGESAAVAAQLPDSVKVVDMGADFRLIDAAQWEASYGVPHAGTWTYGIPELPGQRQLIADSTRVAAAGCYPTATALALAPLFAAGVVEPADLVVVASSGTTGAGRAAKVNLLGSEVMGDLCAYKVASHQHAPEIRQSLSSAGGQAVSLSFTTVLAPMPRGILATSTARVRAGVTEAHLRGVMVAAYADEPFVHVLPEGQWPHTAATVGSNCCHLQVGLDAAAGRAVVISAIDNLGKGAAGQAIQIANLLLGLDETSGLSVDGVAP